MKSAYVFVYYRYMVRYEEGHATLEEAVRSWASGEDAGELWGKKIMDASGEVAVTHEEFLRGGLWRACDTGKIEKVLADPRWREKIAAKIAQEEVELARRREEAQQERIAQEMRWIAMIERVNHKTRSHATYGVRRTWIDCGIGGIDPSPDAWRIPGMAYPYVKVEKREMPLYVTTTEEEIEQFLSLNRVWR